MKSYLLNTRNIVVDVQPKGFLKITGGWKLVPGNVRSENGTWMRDWAGKMTQRLMMSLGWRSRSRSAKSFSITRSVLTSRNMTSKPQRAWRDVGTNLQYTVLPLLKCMM